MRTFYLFLGVSILVMVFAVSVNAQGGMGPGMMGGSHGYGMGPGMMGGGYNYCPYCGAYQGGYGMMGGSGHGRGYGPGRVYRGQGQSEACQSFFNETQGLRKDLMNKRFEYAEAMRNPKTNPDTLSNLEKQMDDLQGKIQAKNTQGCWW